jgi:two-component system response regulator ChvI
LVVDDESDIALTIKKALEREDFEVDAFTDPQKAIESFEPRKYAMLLTDVRMPDMSGFELYREVRKRDGEIRVAFMTAFEVNKDEFRKVLPSTDVKCFFKKPIRVDELVERVRQETSEEFTMS